MNTKDFFKKAEAELHALTNKYANYDINGHTSLEYGAVKLVGTHPDYNVFDVEASDLKNAVEVKIEVPSSATTIINVRGKMVSFPPGSVFYNGLSGGGSLPYASTILWNMPDALNISTTQSGVFGSILAPYADVDSVQGQINGNLIVKSLKGHIESHLHLFRPCVMPPDPEVELTELTVNKIWDDNNDLNQQRPETITVSLIADGDEENPVDQVELSEANHWTHTFKNLSKEKDGVEIVYTIVEEDVSHYVGSFEVKDNIIELTNTYVEEMTRLSIEKQWDDEANRDGLRPKEIVISVIANHDLKNPVVTKSIKPNQFGQWKLEIENLPVYKDGKKIDYKVIEKAVLGYSSRVSETRSNEFVLVNTRTEAFRDLSISKVWQDENNREGLRPTTIEIMLIANDDEENPIDIISIEADAQGNWFYEFKGLPVYQDGVEIVYTIKEKTIEHYESVIRGDMEEGYVITNTLIPDDPEDPDVPGDPKTPKDPDDPTGPKEPEQPKEPVVPKEPKVPTSPKTGVNNNVFIYIGLILVASVTLIRMKIKKH